MNNYQKRLARYLNKRRSKKCKILSYYKFRKIIRKAQKHSDKLLGGKGNSKLTRGLSYKKEGIK